MDHSVWKIALFLTPYQWQISVLTAMEAFQLNTENYKHCVHNIIGSEDLFSKDLIERIIRKNPWTSLWTVEIGDESLFDPTFQPLICAVNIFIKEDGCPEHVRKGFRNQDARVFDFFIVIFGSTSSCNVRWNEIRKSSAISGVGIYYFNVHKETGKLINLQFFCSSCPAELTTTTMDGELSLEEIHSIGKAIQTKFLKSIISAVAGKVEATWRFCRFLYSTVRVVNPRDIRCSVPRIFIELAAHKLNMSVEYVKAASTYLVIQKTRNFDPPTHPLPLARYRKDHALHV